MSARTLMAVTFLLLVFAASGCRSGSLNKAQAERLLQLRVECRAGPEAVPPGVQPVLARAIQLELPATLRRLTHRLGGAVETVEERLDAATAQRLTELAQAAARELPFEAEAPVPDGRVCRLEFIRASGTQAVQATVPTRHEALAPLLAELARWL